MAERYLQVTPSTDRYDPAIVPDEIRGLHGLEFPAPDGLLATLNPFEGTRIPRFEFTVLSAGKEAPVRFFYGVDEYHLETLETRLRDLYPASFDVEVVETDPARYLVPPKPYDPVAFATAVEQADLWIDPEESTAIAHDGGVAVHEGAGDLPTAIDGLVAGPDALPTEQPLTTLEGPTLTPEGEILARPSLDELVPMGYRWHGLGKRKRDWMCQLTSFTDAADADRAQSYNIEGGRRLPLARLVDRLGKATIPLGFQVVFRREPSWRAEAMNRVADLRHSRETRFEKLEGLLWGTHLEKSDLDDLPSSYPRRIDEIEAIDPQYTFAATIRALTVPDAVDDDRSMPDELERLASLFFELNGEFYELDPHRVRETGRGFRTETKDAQARKAFERFRNRQLHATEENARDRPQVILTADELANFVTVPSGEDLAVEARRETEAEEATRSVLPRPRPRLLREFDTGMAIGRALNEVGDPVGDPVRVPPDLLTRHIARFAGSGHGKSVAVITDLLSTHAATEGPSVLLDPKGDGMCRNYLRAHYATYGDLEDVIYFRVPEMLPAIPFFDIRPALAAGQDWETAVQDRVEHFRELLRLIMTEETHDRAYLANDILGFLIKAMFDPEHGQAAFGIDDLYQAVIRMQRDQVLPPVSMEYIEIEETLANFFEKSPGTIETTLSAMEGRVNSLKDKLHVYRMLSTTPEWDPDQEEYVGDVFDFREFLDEDVVILFDIGGLRARGQRAFSMALLSNIWDAIRPRGREDKSGTDYPLVNLIMEEAAPLATSQLMYEELIPQGRSFGIGLEFVMQYPEQVRRAGGRDGGQRAYDELLNNVGTTLVGNIDKQDDLATAVAGGGYEPAELATRMGDLPRGEWIADLPAPIFRETGAAPFSVASMPIPEGHPDDPLGARQERQFTDELATLKASVAATYGLGDESATESEPDDRTDAQDDPADTAGESDAVASLFDDGTAESSDAAAEMASNETPVDGEEPTESRGAAGADDDRQPNECEGEGSDEGLFGSGIPEADDGAEETLSNLNPEQRFLKTILDAMNRDLADYSLVESMRTLKERHEDADIDRLLDEGYLEQHTLGSSGWKYYTVLPKGRRYLRESLTTAEGVGDLGEKTPHKVGVSLLGHWLRDQDGVAEVAMYHHHDDVIFDVAAFDHDGDLVWVGEVETETNDRDSVREDYDKLAAADAKAIWVFENRDAAVDSIAALADGDYLPERVTGRAARTYSGIREWAEGIDAPGMTTVRGFPALFTQIDS